MRLDRLTTKTREALLSGQTDATKRGNPELYPEHVVIALLEQSGGVAPAIVQKAGLDPRALRDELAKKLEGMPRVSGSTTEPALSRRTRIRKSGARWALPLPWKTAGSMERIITTTNPNRPYRQRQLCSGVTTRASGGR